MYRLKPFYPTNIPFSVPDCMYKLKDIHEYSKNSEDSACGGDMKEEASKLLAQQNVILEKLKDLSVQVQEMLGSGSEVGAMPRKTPALCLKNMGQPVDVVIHCNPQQPPLSLFVLVEMLRESCVCGLAMYHHSSVTSLDTKLSRLTNTHTGVDQRAAHDIIITVIWKMGCDQPVMMLNPLHHTPVRGEVSIARFLWGLYLLTSPPGSHPASQQVERGSNELLDTVTSLLLHPSSGGGARLVREVEGRVASTGRLQGGGSSTTLSLVDVVTWSVVEQLKLHNNKLNNFSKWVQRCKANSYTKLAQTLTA